MKNIDIEHWNGFLPKILIGDHERFFFVWFLFCNVQESIAFELAVLENFFQLKSILNANYYYIFFRVSISNEF